MTSLYRWSQSWRVGRRLSGCWHLPPSSSVASSSSRSPTGHCSWTDLHTDSLTYFGTSWPTSAHVDTLLNTVDPQVQWCAQGVPSQGRGSDPRDRSIEDQGICQLIRGKTVMEAFPAIKGSCGSHKLLCPTWLEHVEAYIKVNTCQQRLKKHWVEQFDPGDRGKTQTEMSGCLDAALRWRCYRPSSHAIRL